MKIYEFEFGGEKLPFYFGLESLDEATQGIKYDKDRTPITSIIKQMRYAFQAGLRSGLKKQGKKIDHLTPPKFLEIIESNPENFAKVFEAYQEESQRFLQFTDVDDLTKK